jgi:hypothetical protein
VSRPFHPLPMKKALRAADVEALIREIQRYLVCVEAFRAAERRQPPTERRDGNRP